MLIKSNTYYKKEDNSFHNTKRNKALKRWQPVTLPWNTGLALDLAAAIWHVSTHPSPLLALAS